MNAIEFLEKIRIICEHHLNCDDGCPLKTWYDKNLYSLSEDPKKVIEVVEKWTNEHPVKTRQSEFLKMFPNAQLDDDGMFNFSLNPCDIDPEYADKVCDQYSDCQDCQREYWSEEVE